MLTGDSATVDEGPQIVFSESGSGSNFVGGAIGFRRTGGNGDQMCLGYAESADRFAFMVNYPVPMRQNPSFNGSATTVRFYANNPSQTWHSTVVRICRF